MSFGICLLGPDYYQEQRPNDLFINLKKLLCKIMFTCIFTDVLGSMKPFKALHNNLKPLPALTMNILFKICIKKLASKWKYNLWEVANFYLKNGGKRIIQMLTVYLRYNYLWVIIAVNFTDIYYNIMS